ncbi:hypothetical protein [Chromobacterium sp. CV08]|uniref:hypothetical protein n=1 Tax=Chromobacterium sp. CV08 TaxID=3133274 RepID=UPI003DA97710
MPNIQAPWPVENSSAETLKILDASPSPSSSANEEENDESLYQAKNLRYLEAQSSFALKPEVSETLDIAYDADKDWNVIFARESDLFPISEKELDLDIETGKYAKSTIPKDAPDQTMLALKYLKQVWADPSTKIATSFNQILMKTMPILQWSKANNLIISYINNTLGVDQKTENKTTQTLQSLASFAIVASYINRFPNALLHDAGPTYHVYDAGDSELDQKIKPPLQVVAQIKITSPKVGELPLGANDNGGYKVQFVMSGHDPIDLLYKDGVFTNSNGKIKLKPAWLKRKIIYQGLNTLTHNDANPESIITIFIGEYLNRGALGIPDEIKTEENSKKPDPKSPPPSTKEKAATPDDAQWKTKLGFSFLGILVTAASVMGWCLMRRYACGKKLSRQFPRLGRTFFNNDYAQSIPLDDDLDSEINTAEIETDNLIVTETAREPTLGKTVDIIKKLNGFDFIKKIIKPTRELLAAYNVAQSPSTFEAHIDTIKNYIGSEAASAFKVQFILYSTGQKIESSIKKANTLILKANQQVINLKQMLTGENLSTNLTDIITQYHDDIAKIANTSAEGLKIKNELVKTVDSFIISTQATSDFLSNNKVKLSTLFDRINQYTQNHQSQLDAFNHDFDNLNKQVLSASLPTPNYNDYKTLTLNISEEIAELKNRIEDIKNHLQDMAERETKG